jgi:hypothetical protein
VLTRACRFRTNELVALIEQFATGRDFDVDQLAVRVGLRFLA